jgi:DNA ligase (NAD+)
MLSLNKTKDYSDVNTFCKNKTVLGMCKMDGLTLSLRYNKGRLISAETRGNGSEGEDVLHNVVMIPSIPKKIRFVDELIIDGEIICRYNDFNDFKKDYKNPRNFAAGSIRLLDANECSTRNLTFVAWDVIKGFDSIPTLKERLTNLSKYGFITVPFVTIPAGSEITETTTTLIKELADEKSFPIDGVVFKFNDVQYGASLGQTSHHFNNAIAFKFYDELYPTIIKDIEWTMGRTGVLTPVAVLEPIEIDGSEVSRASLHNVSVMKSTLGDMPYYGQKVEVFKANMIIPQIKTAVLWEDVDLKAGEELTSISMPCTCPICGQILSLKNNEGVMTLVCGNPACEGKFINKLDHFCSKKGLDIKGLSKATLEKLINWGFVNSYEDIFKLKNIKSQWAKKPGFGMKSVENILNAIEDAKHTTLDKVISAAGIPLIGMTVAKDLNKKFDSYESFREAVNKKFDFSVFNGYGPEMNKSILSFDYSEIDKIVVNYLIIEKPMEEEKEQTLEGKVFVITGKLKNYKNRDELKQQIEAFGGRVAGSVTKKTNYLINNDNTSTTSKNITAKTLGVPIITEEEFIKIFDMN